MAEINLTLTLPTVDGLDQILGIIVISDAFCDVDHAGTGIIVHHSHPALTIQTNLQDHPGWDAEKIKATVRKLLGGFSEQLENMKVQGQVS